MSVATSYAKALFETARDAKATGDTLDTIDAQLHAFEDALATSKEVQVALLAPVSTAKEKAALIEAVASKLKLEPLVANFLLLMAKKNRLGSIREIRSAFLAARLQAEGGLGATLTSAEPMTKADIESLTAAFSKRLGKKIAFQVSTDPNLLAGLKVTVGGVTYDGSLRSQLQKLRDQIAVAQPGTTH